MTLSKKEQSLLGFLAALLLCPFAESFLAAVTEFPMNITWLGNPLSHNPRRVGGKAANLSRLAARHPVPPGFCLTAGSLPVSGPSDEWVEPISHAYLALGKRCGAFPPAVAVRSSAVDEDGQQASFAGQYESYLNCCGLEAVLAAVQRCLDSAHSERARCYRETMVEPRTKFAVETRFALETRSRQARPEIAVLVQQFVHADISVVVFSLDPVSGARDRVVINAAWGLGESLVSGSVTPDLYTARKIDGVLLQSQIADKASMSIPAEGGTRVVAVPRPMRCQPALDAAQITALVHLACQLETQMGWPVDLECSFVGEKLYLLQCRPITCAPGIESPG
jgi:pyruvate,water dikinase